MKIESLIKEVAGIADDLNSMGAAKAAQSVDGVLLKIANETIVMDEVVIKGRTPEQKETIRTYNANVQEYINEILKLQGEPPISNADGKITAKDKAWLERNIGAYNSWPTLFEKLQTVLSQAQALHSVPPDMDPIDRMNKHYTDTLEKDRKKMQDDTSAFTKSTVPEPEFNAREFRSPNPHR